MEKKLQSDEAKFEIITLSSKICILWSHGAERHYLFAGWHHRQTKSAPIYSLECTVIGMKTKDECNALRLPSGVRNERVQQEPYDHAEEESYLFTVSC
ncbi:Protein of unknown function, partial [Gryllus bimaculatus]